LPGEPQLEKERALTDVDLLTRVGESVAASTGYLYRRQRPDGAWTDRLSSSAAPTALATLAFARASRSRYRREIEAGLGWLRRNQRADGGWSLADADPPSDISVTAFAIAAFKVLDPGNSAAFIDRGMEFIGANGGESAVFPNIRTWRELVSVTWAMEGLRAPDDQPVQPLEIMLLPSRLRNRASIALPGVIGLGIGQSRMMSLSRLARAARRLAEPRGLAWLRAATGPNGGIEECPLMAALVFTGLRLAGEDVGGDIQRDCLRYLEQTQRPDGSWAIDRDLEIAVTAYAVFALAECGDVAADPRLALTRDWLLSTQWKEPFKPLGLPAGGWSWAAPSGWPESEDTAVVLSALTALGVPSDHPAIRRGLRWLYAMQNTDGSWSEWIRNSSQVHDGPCAGVTSHVVMALHRLAQRGDRARIDRALGYFRSAQHQDGSIPSLWFRDRTHGTAKLLETHAELGMAGDPVASGAYRWLLDNQRDDGAWPAKIVEGAPEGGTVEETAWALYSLLRAGAPPWDRRVTAAVEWLLARQDAAGTWPQSVVGLYYDTLYYSDDLIAHTYALRALGRWLGCAGPVGSGEQAYTRGSRVVLEA
jgi:squalene-hopene/tetraprenyl-beta-curcumene cyclase